MSITRRCYLLRSYVCRGVILCAVCVPLCTTASSTQLGSPFARYARLASTTEYLNGAARGLLIYFKSAKELNSRSSWLQLKLAMTDNLHGGPEKSATCFPVPSYIEKSKLISASLVLTVLILISVTFFGSRKIWRECDRRKKIRMQCEINIRQSHDILLQELQGLVLRFEAVARKMHAEEPLRTVMEAVLKRADRVVLEGRDRILNLQVTADCDLQLSAALASLAERYSPDGAINFSVVVEGAERQLRNSAYDLLYLIAEEAVKNAFLHAKADHIEVEINHGDQWFRLRVRDDGIGIDSQILEYKKSSHRGGLATIRELTLQIGAELAIWGRDGLGTEVEVKLNAAGAYIVRRKSILSNLIGLSAIGKRNE